MTDPVKASGELNLKQVAVTLGVHYMTAYRYVRQGRLDARRDGTEWRVTADVLREFMSVPGSQLPTGPHSTGGVDWSDRIEGCLIAGDETAAWRVIENALAGGRSPEFCYVDMVARALEEIARRSDVDDLPVADQYVANAVASRIVARLGARFRRPGRTRGNIVFGAPRGEFHTISVAIYSDLLRLAGFDVLELGADVPAEAFVESVRGTGRLICVGIGVTRPDALNAARIVIDAVRLVNPEMPIALGGLAGRVPGAATLTNSAPIDRNGRDAVHVIESLARSRSDRGA
ncbi:MAG TPA: helix-turn-helix domain-containing protein [Acidimicrobiales bacterium]|nr:helix-turn-helix domain-containing protein [Acidimicrobiales bacterium]